MTADPTGDGDLSTRARSGDVAISPAPTEEEVAAIMAASIALWPEPVAEAPARAQRTSAWRLSGRWWAKPLPVRRDRPWR